MVDSASPDSDVSDLSDKLESLRSEWKDLQASVAARQAALKEASRLAEKFRNDAELLGAWMGLTEEKLQAEQSVSLQSEELSKQLKCPEAPELLVGGGPCVGARGRGCGGISTSL